ncbi:MAG TPA: hypothetical protein VKN14_04720, partial [Flavobacteriaceae bacterium]|nr:hypothetical protein [Flavobacteriaceae bacterium]
TNQEVLFELEKVIATINDGHTGLFLPFNNSLKHEYIPLSLLSLDNALVVKNTIDKRKELIGLKLKSIDGIEIGQLYSLIKKFILHENKYGQKNLFSEYAVNADLLKFVGVPIISNSVKCLFENPKGKEITAELTFIPKSEYMLLQDNVLFATSVKDKPLWLNTDLGKYWSEKVNDLFYIQLNSSDIQNKDRDKIESFSKQIIKYAASDSITSIVLDLRMNSGGSITNTSSLFRAFVTIDQIYPNKKLFVLIGNKTFSAASVLATLINRETNAIFIGSPTGGKPNLVGDIGRIQLPNRKITVRYSRLHIKPSEAWDARPAIFPDFRAPITYKNFNESIDPAITIINNYKEKKDLFDDLIIYKDDVNKLIKIYNELKKNQYNEFMFDVKLLDRIGINLYRDKVMNSALKIFELNVSEYPWSPLAHSNFGEINIEMGNSEIGMKHLEIAFKIHKGYSKWRDELNKINLKN